jgi:hypothetical protein
MRSCTSLATVVIAIAPQLAGASGPFKFCKDNECNSCPVQVTDAGVGYPNCVIYSTKDVFGNIDGFPGSSSGLARFWKH